MSDFLTRLAERAIAPSPAVKPVIAPMFAAGPNIAPSAITGGSAAPSAGDVDRGSVPHPERVQPPAEGLHGPRPPLPTESDDGPPRRGTVPTFGPIMRPDAADSDAASSATHSNAAEIHPQEAHYSGLPSRFFTASESGKREIESQTAQPGTSPKTSKEQAAESALPVHEGNATLIVPLAVPAMDTNAAQHDPRGGAANSTQPVEASPPPIRITIGRVEVRAVFPGAPARPTAAPPPRHQPLSLNEYLKLRNGGQR
jgi:hypothetical protein